MAAALPAGSFERLPDELLAYCLAYDPLSDVGTLLGHWETLRSAQLVNRRWSAVAGPSFKTLLIVQTHALAEKWLEAIAAARSDGRGERLRTLAFFDGACKETTAQAIITASPDLHALRLPTLDPLIAALASGVSLPRLWHLTVRGLALGSVHLNDTLPRLRTLVGLDVIDDDSAGLHAPIRSASSIRCLDLTYFVKDPGVSIACIASLGGLERFNLGSIDWPELESIFQDLQQPMPGLRHLDLRLFPGESPIDLDPADVQYALDNMMRSLGQAWTRAAYLFPSLRRLDVCVCTESPADPAIVPPALLPTLASQLRTGAFLPSLVTITVEIGNDPDASALDDLRSACDARAIALQLV